jgi:hypothetical protein
MGIGESAMFMQIAFWTTAALSLVVAALSWRSYQNACLQPRKMVFLFATSFFVVVGLAESCLAIWE